MMNNLWAANTPERFWRCQSEIPEDVWQRAVAQAVGVLALAVAPDTLADVLHMTLGEGQFGPGHWTLGRAKRLYYRVKPAIPRPAIRLMRHLYHRQPAVGLDGFQRQGGLAWPIEDRYVRFLWAVMAAVMVDLEADSLPYCRFWPGGKQAALVLTHDIETAEGQAFVPQVAALESDLGLRSSFNFVPERYPLDQALIAELRRGGFEVGIHGLIHDGRLFESRREFDRRAGRINLHLDRLDAAGFRSPCTLRNPDWMQILDIDYDLSFFDTDPFEPIPGGVMTLWPFEIGHFLELPYTLPQDHTLTVVLGERTPRLWLKKLQFIEAHGGMALVNTHPDYLKDRPTWDVYAQFLHVVRCMDLWNALPRDVARWWRWRTDPTAEGTGPPGLPPAVQGRLTLTGQSVQIRD